MKKIDKIYLVSLDQKNFVFQSIKKTNCRFYMIDFKKSHPKDSIYLYEQEEGSNEIKLIETL